MAHSGQEARPMRNRLLADLPPEEDAQLRPYLERVSLGVKDVLYEPYQPIPAMYFPETGVISMLAIMGDGKTSEVGLVGNEGVLGLPVFLGAETSPTRAFAQVPGESLRMAAAVFTEVLPRAGTLMRRLQRYTQALFIQVSQSAACNNLHETMPRCCRWLLMTHDRVGSDEFLLTHEFLAAMLGVRRASVSAEAATLQQAGLIRYRRGQLTIVNRQGLEAAACECYRIIATEYDRLLGPPSAGVHRVHTLQRGSHLGDP
jgi:CRP-like cAMP-binding protein